MLIVEGIDEVGLGLIELLSVVFHVPNYPSGDSNDVIFENRLGLIRLLLLLIHKTF